MLKRKEKQSIPGTWTDLSAGSCAADPAVSQTSPSAQTKTQIQNLTTTQKGNTGERKFATI